MRRVSTFALGLLLLAGPALAGEKKKDNAPDFNDLFGAPPAKGGGLDAMKKATEGVGTKTGGSDLAPKVGAIDNDAPVQLLNVFAAERIMQDKKLGCQPGTKDKKKVTEWQFDDVPAKGQPFAVCLTLASAAGREMNMSISIVDSRSQRVAKAEDVVDFRGRPKVDHVLEYPAPTFKMAGQHFYVVDLDGKEVGRLPLFMVKVDASTSGVNGSTPPDAPVAPVTASGSSSSKGGSMVSGEPDGT